MITRELVQKGIEALKAQQQNSFNDASRVLAESLGAEEAERFLNTSAFEALQLVTLADLIRLAVED